MVHEKSMHAEGHQFQRLDPLMILWPVLILGLSGLALALSTTAGLVLSPESLATSGSVIDGFMYSQIGTIFPIILVACIGIIGVVFGYLFYRRMDVRNTDNPESPTMTITKRVLVSILAFTTIILFLQAVLSYPTAYVVSPEVFLLDSFLILIGSISAVIGLGIVTDYYELTALARVKNAHVEAFAVWVSESPSVVREASNLIGGALLMLYDPRVKFALFKTVENPPGYWEQKGVSPDKVRREQRLHM